MQKRSLKSLNILIAEDDLVNQVLAKAILKKIGCTYEIVENGEKILESLRNSRYDLILMDIEMPNMDGYQTTLKIRRELSPPQSTTPIFAITAHVNDNELLRCLEVGMNDYIFKPLKYEELIKKIKVFLKDIDNEPIDEPLKSPVNDNKKETFNFKALSIACGNNATIAKNIIKLFIAQTPENMKQLKYFLSQSNWSDFKNLCHKMKAVYALLGFTSIKAYLEEMEKDDSGNNINVVKFESYITLIQEANSAITHALEEVLKNEK